MEEKYIKGIIIATIAVLVGLAFWSTVGSSIGTLAVIQTSTNASFTFPANGSTSDLTTCGQLNTTTITVYNYTNNTGSVGLLIPVFLAILIAFAAIPDLREWIGFSK